MSSESGKRMVERAEAIKSRAKTPEAAISELVAEGLPGFAWSVAQGITGQENMNYVEFLDRYVWRGIAEVVTEEDLHK